MAAFDVTTRFGRGVMALGLLLLGSVAVRAHSDATPRFEIVVANFASPDSALSRLTVFAKVVFDEVQFIKTPEDRFSAEYEVTVDVFNAAGEAVDGRVIHEQLVVDTIQQTATRKTAQITEARFDLSPDTYRVYVQMEDLETFHKSVQTADITLRDYREPGNLVSDILILDDYHLEEGNQYVFSPRVSHTIRENARLYVYFEVYRVAPSDSFQVQYAVLNKKGRVWWSDAYWRQGAGPTTQNLIAIEGDSLTHGTYVVQLKVTHRDRTLAFEQPFDWFVEGLPLEFTSLEKAIEVLRYLATPDEYKKLMRLPPEQRYRGYLEFWKSKDPTPETPENELREEYYERILYANANFHGMGREGWETDMGWVYVTLGAPDAIERNPYNQAVGAGRVVKAAEVWTYYKHSKQLLFVDENGFGDYRLENRSTFYDIIR